MANDLPALAKAFGFDDARWVSCDQIALCRDFRSQCAANACGLYGRCHMCPPDVGDIDELMARVRAYPGGLLFSSVHPLEDSFDIEGMLQGGRIHGERSRRFACALRLKGYESFLHLSRGGCGVCSPCAKAEGLPCRFPERAVSSLEAYGVDVSRTAKNAAMAYTNGANTVTYFSLILLKENVPCPD